MYEDVGRVSAELVVSGLNQSPDEISNTIGVRYQYGHKLGDSIFNSNGTIVGKRRSNYWSYSSEMIVDSKSLDEHLQKLLSIFLPVMPRVKELLQRNNVFIFAHWESSRLVGGSGPIISPSSCGGIETLGVELHFDIYCSLGHEA